MRRPDRPRHHDRSRRWAGGALAVLMLLGCTGKVARRLPPPAVDAAPVDALPPPAVDAEIPDLALPPDLAEPDAAAPIADVRPPADVAVGAPGAWAQQIRIGLCEASQAVFIKLGDGATVAAAADRNSTLIEGRAMFVRVHVRPDPGFSPKVLRAVLTLESADGSKQLFEDSKMIAAASDTEKLDSSFNYLVPADLIKPDARMVAAVYESGEPGGPDPATLPRFPLTGSLDLAIRAGPMLMEVVLMPVRGPSGPLDDAPARRQRVENYLADVYPAQKMTIRWRDPVTITSIIDSSTAFKMMQNARRQDGAFPGAYYHMIIAVEDSVEKFLGLGSLAGPRPGDAADRIAMTMVTMHQVDSQLDTIAHEMGHNLGRNHAPGCNAAGVDARFPYPSTGVGVDGYSLGEKATGRDHLPNAPGPFKSKVKFKDVMGYCYPTWISDYTWNAFAARIRTVTEFSSMTASALEDRSLRGYYAPGRAPAWVVVAGDSVPPDTAVTLRRHARITLRDGSRTIAPVAFQRLLSPAGPEDRARSVAVTLPAEGEVAKVEVFLDGERLEASGVDLD
jgi:hypothetical protein